MMDSTFGARTIFRNLGCNSIDVQLATQHAFYKPITSDPTMLSTQALVKAMQRGLQGLGAPITPTGELTPQTAYYLEELAGPSWKNMSWTVLGKKIIQKKRLGQNFSDADGLAVAGLGSVDFAGRAVLLPVIAAFVLYSVFKK